MVEIVLGLLAVGPLSVWAIAFSLSKRRTSQPALAAYLSVTALSWVALLIGQAAGWFASPAQYTRFYVASEIITWGLLAAVFLELASRRLGEVPRLREAADRAVRWFLFAAAIAVFGFVFAPESLIRSTRDFHEVERSLIQVTLAFSWVVFFLAGKYFNIHPTGRNAAEGWLLAALYLGCSVLQPSASFATWIAICLLSAVCYGYGALLHFRPQGSSPEQPKPKRYIGSESAELAVRKARARFDVLDERFDSIGKG